MLINTLSCAHRADPPCASTSCQRTGAKARLKNTNSRGSAACALLVLRSAVGGVEVVICSLGGIQDMEGARAS